MNVVLLPLFRKLHWLVAICVSSCISTEVIGYEPPEQAVDTMAKKERPMPPRPPKDTTDQDGRVPIGWDASVEDWDEKVIEL